MNTVKTAIAQATPSIEVAAQTTLPTQGNTMNNTVTTSNPAPLEAPLDLNEILAMPFYDTVKVAVPTKEEVQLTKNALLEQALKDMMSEYNTAEAEVLGQNMAKVNGAVQAVRLLRAFQAVKGEQAMYVQLIRALLVHTRYWDAAVKTNALGFTETRVIRADDETRKAYHEGRKTYANYYEETLKFFMATAEGKIREAYEGMLKDFQQALALHNGHRIMSNTDVEAQFTNSYTRNKVLAKKFVSELAVPQMVQLRVTNSGVRMMAKPGVVFNYAGETISTVTTRQHDYPLTVEEVNKGLFTVVDRICFHLEYEFEGKTLLSSRPTYPMGSKLNGVFLMKASNLDYGVLLESGKEQYRKIVSVAPNGTLSAVENPMGNSSIRYSYPEVGVASSSDTLAGYIAPLVDIDNLLVVNKDNAGNVRVYSQEGINKAMARHKGMNNTNKGWNMGSIDVNVVFSTKEYLTMDADFNIKAIPMDKTVMAKAVHDFGPSPLLLCKEEFLRAGHGRVVSTMAQGGLKAVTNYSSLAPEGLNFTGPNAFKGGILAAALLTWNAHQAEKMDMAMLIGRQDLVDMVVKHAVSKLIPMEFNGYIVQVLPVTIEYRMTTPYTIDAFKLKEENLWEADEQIDLQAEMDAVVSSANQKVSSLRERLFRQIMADRNFKAVEELYSGVMDGRYVAKELGSRITATAWDSLAVWNGQEPTTTLMDELVEKLTENFADRKVKRTAMRLATGKAKNHILAQVDATVLAEVLRNYCPTTLANTINTYPTEVLKEINKLLGNPMACRGAKFVEINFDGIKVLFPMLSPLFYVERECKAPGKFLATGMLKDLLTALKGFLKSDTTASIHQDSIKGQGMKLRARIQSQLLGKNLGYLNVDGTYLAATNVIGMYDMPVDAIFTTNQDLLWDKDGKPVTQILRGKYPLYHDRTMSRVDLVEITLGDDMIDFAMLKAAFVHHIQMFAKGDDFDGDLLQTLIASLSTIKMFERFNAYDNIAGRFFKRSARKEGETSINTELTFHTYTVEEVKDAIVASATASRNIGLFTTLKNRVEAILAGLTEFTGVNGQLNTMDDKQRAEVNQFMAFLCQTESMDNMKQKDGKSLDFIMNLLAVHKIKNIKGANGSTDADSVNDARITYARNVANRVAEVVAEEGIEVDTMFPIYFVDVMFYAADQANSVGTRNLDFFRNALVDIKFNNEIANVLKAGTLAIDTAFECDMAGTAVNLDKAADAHSMSARLLRKLAQV